ncbi:hypothetical protein LTR56_007149 [Elasticomyces elasticus]|nr:hypothetical protein LTR22_020430 [Elasticomyces elasticus]KAK3649017.1 hypothetical protein LTR56_007149 [Elasticomyces elasticus]KAK4917783.1 hypothetical protein LTR49_014320 [Elasticomyces elasticus]KAK5740453.1 hypothetical protein LTS12_024941 [Elasticomyces elasticus]
MTAQSVENSGLTPELSLCSLPHARAAAQAVCDNHDMPAPTEASNSQPAIPLIPALGRVACAVCRSRRIRCSHKFIPCAECRERKISCAHRVTTESEKTAALLSSLSLESKNSAAFSSTSAQEESHLLPDAGSSGPRLPADDSRVGMERGPLMRRRAMFIPRDSEGTLYLESGPPTSSDDEDPKVRAGKEMDRLLDSVAKQRKEQRNRPMLYVYLGPGTGQADDREKPLRLQDMIRRQVDQHESKVDEGWTSHLCDRTVATNEAKFKANGDEKGYDLTADSGSSKTEANAEDGQASQVEVDDK